jgi:hypothetical protein
LTGFVDWLGNTAIACPASAIDSMAEFADFVQLKRAAIALARRQKAAKP